MKHFFLRLWNKWKKIAHVIGVFNTKLVLTLFYYMALLPFGLLVRLFMDPLQLKTTPKTTAWLPARPANKTISDLLKQS